jgi:hypothetical protein
MRSYITGMKFKQLVGSFDDLDLHEHALIQCLNNKGMHMTILLKSILETATEQRMFMERIYLVYRRDLLDRTQTLLQF